MADTKPEGLTETVSTVFVAGNSNFTASDLEPAGIRPYSSVSYTVGAVFEAVDREPQGEPSKPLTKAAINAIDSVLRARVPESRILRDDTEDR